MKKTFKKVLSVVLSIAMVVASITVTNTTAKAATLEELTSMIADADYNLALNKDTAVYPGVAEGDQVNLNNGAFGAGGAHCALSSAWGYTGESYAVIDLGAYYDASTLDEIVIQYKDAADNDTVIGRSYKIQYSMDGVEYYDAVAETQVTALDENRMTIDDVSGVTGTVRYVKVDYPTTAQYGIQITEIAVFAADPQEAEVEECENAAAVSAVSGGEGEIIVNITAGEGQEGYTYVVYVDNSSSPALNNCVAGQDYTIKGVTSGTHTVKVVSLYNGALSSGLVSGEVIVKTVMDFIQDPTKNLAFQKTYALSSGNSTEGTGSVTDGVVDTTYATPTKGTPGSWFEIDLGSNLDPSYLTAVHVWYRLDYGGCYPGSGGQQVQFSDEDKVEWVTVGTTTQDDFNAQKGVAPFDITTAITDTSEIKAVRYVRVYYPDSVAYGAQVSEIAVIGTAVAAEVGAEVEAPASVTATSPAYNTVEVVVAAPEGDGDYSEYTYQLTLNGETKMVTPGVAVTFTGVPAGSYVATVRAIDADGNKSPIVSSEAVTVEDGFTYSSATAADNDGRLFPDTNDNGNNYVRFEAAYGTASSGTADAALDNNSGSRWESASSDPQWICINLGAVYSVKEIDASWEAANSKDFYIEVSTDNEVWTKIATVTGAANGGNRVDTIVLKDAVDAQYVRLTGTARNLNYGHSIWEMAVYGPDSEVVVEEQAPDQSYDEVTDWVMVGSEANANFTTADGEYSYYVSETFRNSMINHVDLFGLYSDHAGTPYHPANCTVTGAVYVSAYPSIAGTMKAVWVDGVKYESGTELCYIDGDQVHLAQSIFSEVKEYAVTIVVNSGDTYTYGLLVDEAPEIETTTTAPIVAVPDGQNLISDTTVWMLNNEADEWSDTALGTGNAFTVSDVYMTANWYSLMAHTSLVLEAGKTYKISFTMTSPVIKQFAVVANTGGDNFLASSATAEWTGDAETGYTCDYEAIFTWTGETMIQNFVIALGQFDVATDSASGVVADDTLALTDAVNVSVADIVLVTTDEIPSEDETTTESEATVPAAVVGLTYAGNADLPYYFAWQPSEGATSYNVYVNGELVTSVIDTNANLDAELFAEAGDYTIEVTAVNEVGESDATTITYTVEDKSVCMIGNKKYNSLEEAVEDAVDGDTITLIANASPAEAIKVRKDLTLNLGGYTLTLPETGNYAIVIYDTLTIEGEGEVVADCAYGIGLATSCTGGLNINGGTYTGTEENVYLIGGFAGKISITEGEFSSPYCVVNSFDGYTCEVEITGGEFTSTHELDPESASSILGINYSISGGTFSEEVPEEYCAEGFVPADNGDGTYGVTEAKYEITVDGEVVAEVKEGEEYTLPTDATYGYFDGTAMHKAGTTITVTADVAFTSVNELAVTAAQGAGIKVDGETNGIRFQATVTSDNMTAVNSDAITEGMLITAEDLYTEFGNSVLDLDSTYAKIKVDNEGWFMNQEGVYCGSVVNIDDANCIRNFIARAYVTINYADGTSEVVYSDMSGARSISGVAKAIIAAGHLANFDADVQAIISAYAEY